MQFIKEGCLQLKNTIFSLSKCFISVDKVLIFIILSIYILIPSLLINHVEIQTEIVLIIFLSSLNVLLFIFIIYLNRKSENRASDIINIKKDLSKVREEVKTLHLQIFSQNSWRMSLIYDQNLKLNDQYSKDDVTVIIPIRNRNDYRLPNALKSLRNQNYNKNLIHIYVIDYDGSTEFIDSLKNICESYSVHYMRIENRSGWNKSKCINIGLRDAITKYVLLSDVDIIFENNYISEAVKELQSNPYSIVRCTFRDSIRDDISATTDIINDYQIIKDKSTFRHELLQRSSADYGKGVIFLLKDFLVKIGGLDEFYTA